METGVIDNESMDARSDLAAWIDGPRGAGRR